MIDIQEFKNKGEWKVGDPTWNADLGNAIRENFKEIKKSANRIVQNENGTCVKFENGLMLAFGYKAFVSDFVLLGSMYRTILEDPFFYPESFLENPRIFCQTANSEDYSFSWVYGIVRDKEKISRIDLLRPTAIEKGTVVLHYFAIGKWKEES